ncbi:hypothetical protein [Vibrio coralliilyticus]|uniref:hypothetical protein n=1 Tax=Vibrio coralliilyticus TaxID=190893 RepID=UPI001560D05D|nr:hypothetical protein [Vibrio coralliilyticus]NRF60907.1 hypothetical protein [Vibrio coralliilyticus]
MTILKFLLPLLFLSGCTTSPEETVKESASERCYRENPNFREWINKMRADRENPDFMIWAKNAADILLECDGEGFAAQAEANRRRIESQQNIDRILRQQQADDYKRKYEKLN